MATTYAVEGMMCAGCARSVTNAIQKAAPGTTVSVDLEAGRVTVDGAGDEATVRAAVETAGFGFKGPAA